MFGEKRTQKLSPGLIKDQHGLFYFFSRSLLSTTMTSILIQYGGRMQISKMGLILPYEKKELFLLGIAQTCTKLSNKGTQKLKIAMILVFAFIPPSLEHHDVYEV